MMTNNSYHRAASCVPNVGEQDVQESPFRNRKRHPRKSVDKIKLDIADLFMVNDDQVGFYWVHNYAMTKRWTPSKNFCKKFSTF